MVIVSLSAAFKPPIIPPLATNYLSIVADLWQFSNDHLTGRSIPYESHRTMDSYGAHQVWQEDAGAAGDSEINHFHNPTQRIQRPVQRWGPPSFHLFQQLPAELQIEIWKYYFGPEYNKLSGTVTDPADYGKHFDLDLDDRSVLFSNLSPSKVYVTKKLHNRLLYDAKLGFRNLRCGRSCRVAALDVFRETIEAGNPSFQDVLKDRVVEAIKDMVQWCVE